MVSTVNSGDVTAEVLNLATAGNARLLVACNAGSGSASSAGGVQLYAQDQAIFLRTAATGPTNLIVESNTGGANDGEVICNYGFQNLSDEKLKHSVEPAGLEELQQVFDTVAPKWYRRTEGSQKRTLGFIANEVRETGPVGQALCGKLVDEGARDARLQPHVLRFVGCLPGAPGPRAGAGEEGQEAGPLVSPNKRFGPEGGPVRGGVPNTPPPKHAFWGPKEGL